MIKQILFLVAIISTSWVFGQEATPINLINPSFEGLPTLGKGPRGWVDCGFQGESAPDVHPVISGDFGVSQPAYDGETYLGMVVRDNDTWEAISQYLRQPLQGGQCYRFSVHLACSKMYLSRSRKTNDAANYTTPATIRVWGGNGACDKRQLLYTTRRIISTRWLVQEMEFRPKDDYTYITFEAFYETPVLFPYNGNVLMDNAKTIMPIPCNEEDVIAALEDEEIEGADVALIELNEEEEEGPIAQNAIKETPPAISESPTSTTVVPKIPTPRSTPPKVEPTPTPRSNPIQKPKTNETGLDNIDRRDLLKGTKIPINKLYFEADKSSVKGNSDNILGEIYSFLQKNEHIIVEIGGHTNATPPTRYCDSLSTERAKMVANYMTEKGIEVARVQYKGYGKREPIANNRTAEGRRRNQRVEIKILGFISN